jgi:predicted alpha/beta-fold hydrolase
MLTHSLPPFVPHPLVRGGHAQTILGRFLPLGQLPQPAVHRRCVLSDGDAVLLHDSCPPQWTAGDPLVLLLPGLTGCHQSGYIVRTAAKLNARGIRAVRMDPRGWGASPELARGPFTAACTEDIREALHFLAALAPAAPLGAVGFSLTGNMLLKLLGSGADLPPSLRRAAAMCPPIDLTQCADRLERPLPRRIYGKHFLKYLRQHIRQRQRLRPEDWPAEELRRVQAVRTLLEFDEAFTAGRAGFASAAEYYHTCSAKPHLERITVPTLVIADRDDPVIPGEVFDGVALSPAVTLQVTAGGGHLGFIARRNGDPDLRWLDWRIVDWFEQNHERHERHERHEKAETT